MHIISILLFALSSNMDNMVVGLSYGIKKIRITSVSNLTIGLITFLGTIISMLIGKSLLNIIPVSFAGLLGSLIIIAIGSFYLLKYIYTTIKSKQIPDPQRETTKYGHYDKDKSGKIEWRESFTLGFALSINNIGLGISASIAGMNIAMTAIASLIFSLILTYFSNLFGKTCVSKYLGKCAEPIASILIIILGIYQVLM